MNKIVLLVVLGLTSLPLLAQNSPKVDLFAGYQYLIAGGDQSVSPIGGQNFNGWNAAGTYHFDQDFGLEGDFSGSYTTIAGASAHFFTYTVGPVIFVGGDKVKPFGHFLFGGARISASQSGLAESWNGYTVMIGGGVDAKVNKVVALRALQVDWVYYNFGAKTFSTGTTPPFDLAHNVRISTGVVLRF